MYSLLDKVDHGFVDQSYAGYLVWKEITQESRILFLVEFGLIVLSLLAMMLLARLSPGSSQEAGTRIWPRKGALGIRAIIGFYLIASLVGLLRMFGGSLGSSIGPLIASIGLAYLSCAIWLLMGIVRPQENLTDRRRTLFFLIGMSILAATSFAYPLIHLILSSFGSLVIAAVAVLLMSFQREATGDNTNGAPRLRWDIAAAVSVWLGIVLMVCFVQRAILLENGWHLLRRFVCSASYLLCGFAFFSRNGRQGRPTFLGIPFRAIIVGAALLGMATFTWRASYIAYSLPNIERTIDGIVDELERNKCNHFGIIPVDLAERERAAGWRGEWRGSCEHWQQVVYVGTNKYHLGPPGMATDHYYERFPLSELRTADQLRKALQGHIKEQREFPEFISAELLIGIDRDTPWSRVCEATEVAVEVGYRKVSFLFFAPARERFYVLIAEPPSIVDDLAECRENISVYGGTTIRYCMRQMDRVVAFCPGLLEFRWWGSMGTAAERLRDIAIPDIVTSYSHCLGDMDLDALYAVLAFEFLDRPKSYLRLRFATDEDEDEAVISLPTDTPWYQAIDKIAAYRKVGYSTITTAIRFSVSGSQPLHGE